MKRESFWIFCVQVAFANRCLRIYLSSIMLITSIREFICLEMNIFNEVFFVFEKFFDIFEIYEQRKFFFKKNVYFLFIDWFFRKRLIVFLFWKDFVQKIFLEKILIATNVFVKLEINSLNMKSNSLNMKSNSLNMKSNSLNMKSNSLNKIWLFFVNFNNDRDDVFSEVKSWQRIFYCNVFFTKTLILEIIIDVSFVNTCFQIDIWV
jgi:hypothetical protein